jgi:hypothetical protein
MSEPKFSLNAKVGYGVVVAILVVVDTLVTLRNTMRRLLADGR